MWEGLKKVRKTRSENAGWGGREGGREREKRGGRESGPKSRHSVWEVSQKVKKTCSESAGRRGRGEGGRGGREGGPEGIPLLRGKSGQVWNRKVVKKVQKYVFCVGGVEKSRKNM